MAPSNLTLRSASISSSSTTNSKTSNDGIKKKFACNHSGCGKSFSRSEHLHRHALNHKDGNNTCMRCSAHFRRRDLLDRHMTRHKEKDDEAGGEGLGVLATRKRLWRDTDGNIVNARRPSFTQEGNKRRMTGRKSERNGSIDSEYDDRRSSTQSLMSALPSPISMTRPRSSHSTIIVDTSRSQSYVGSEEPLKPEDEELDQHAWLGLNTAALPSPPQSSSSSYSDNTPSLPSGSQSPSAELDTLYEDTWPITTSGMPQIVNNSPILGRQSEYPASPGWGPQQPFQTFMGAIGEFEDVQPPSQMKNEDYGMGSMGLYGWQNPSPWAGAGQMMVSRCREEKFDPFQERGSVFPAQEVLRRGFGMGTC